MSRKQRKPKSSDPVMAFKFRMYPKPGHDQFLRSMVETVRRTWNRTLNEKTTSYKRGNKGPTFDEIQKELQKKRNAGDPHLAGLSAEAVKDSNRRLKEAYGNFFSGTKKKKGEKRHGFPRYKRKGSDGSVPFKNYRSCVLVAVVRSADSTKDVVVHKQLELQKEDVIEKYYIRLSNGKTRIRIPVVVHRPVLGTVTTATIKLENGRWFLVLTCRVPRNPVAPDSAKSAVGIDLGITSYVTASDGWVVPFPGFLRAKLDKLKELDRAISSKQDGSSRKEKLQQERWRLHQNIADARKNYAHHLANELLEKYGTIVVENLSVASMTQSKKLPKWQRRRLNRQLADAGFRQLIDILKSKATAVGVKVIEVPPEWSSQECSRCGELTPKTLADRVHECPKCSLTICRDRNAAIVILKRANLGNAWETHLEDAIRVSQVATVPQSEQSSAAAGGHEAGTFTDAGADSSGSGAWTAPF